MQRIEKAAALFDEGYNCTELLGVDISQPEAFARAQAEDTFAGTCPDSVRAAAEILVDML